jgi:lipopolysaccharide export LptBFGC system permease protein LptF
VLGQPTGKPVKTPQCTLARHFLWTWAPLFFATLAVLGSAGWLVLLGAEVLRSGLQPTPFGLLVFAIGILPQVISWLVPIAAGVALVGTLADWRSGGQWVGMMAAGLGGRSLWPGVVAISLAVAMAVAVADRVPASQGWVQRVLLEESLPVPGRLVAMGPVKLQAEAAGAEGLQEVQVAVGSWRGRALSGRLEGAWLSLSSGRFENCTGDLQVAFDRAEIRIPLSRDSVSHRHPEYQRSIVFKRTSWPVSVFILLLLCVPAGLGGRNWLPAVALAGHWGLVRTMDHLSPQLGGWVAAWLPTLLVGVFTAVVWSRWRDR